MFYSQVYNRVYTRDYILFLIKTLRERLYMQQMLFSESIGFIETYASASEEYIENRYRVGDALKRLEKEAFRIYLKDQTIEVLVKKDVVASEITVSNIIEIKPELAIYVLEFIHFNYGDLLKNTINIEITQKERKPHEIVEYVNTVVLLAINTRNGRLKLNIIDDKYVLLKKYVKRVKKTITGTLLGLRLPTFNRKRNKTKTPFTIEELRGGDDKRSKNHLLPDEDIYINLTCPVCTDKKDFLYADIKKYMKFKQGIVTIVCNHAGCDKEHQAPYQITIPADLEVPKKIEDLYMYLIQNRKFYGI